ncbi:hypothetical protein T4D_13821 [Trichinella pseudospiralis]|uniref:Uncharacterized protein n=1 Tax=Trichinella pseudospiralis TaxID=6337 RepID=A0A0V1G6A8_TRIPS|nr:hypothetical protein T4D_13821 [Trichinella pseudospiralis]
MLYAAVCFGDVLYIIVQLIKLRRMFFFLANLNFAERDNQSSNDDIIIASGFAPAVSGSRRMYTDRASSLGS